ncbi:MAG TPA: class I SAM-dependent methyltransferase [Terriglobales bacterium]|jgi:arsenite methyltransferase|nr:class I SAM-dependent methyltransferase [Terriglobales bacterium]
MSNDKSQSPEVLLQQEFNRWADNGEGAKMERHHFDITEKTIHRMDLRPEERILDLGCGSGWATRLLARRAGKVPPDSSPVVGVDISDEMIRQARDDSKEFDKVTFVVGSAAQIPWEENYFDKVLSVESFYYYSDQDRALDELFRVMAPQGRLFILINLYQDNPYSLQWVPKLKVPVHIRSAAEYVEVLKKHAFENVEYALIPDDTPTPDNYQTTSFYSLDDLKAFKRIGALLLMASKPGLQKSGLWKL